MTRVYFVTTKIAQFEPKNRKSKNIMTLQSMLVITAKREGGDLHTHEFLIIH